MGYSKRGPRRGPRFRRCAAGSRGGRGWVDSRTGEGDGGDGKAEAGGATQVSPSLSGDAFVAEKARARLFVLLGVPTGEGRYQLGCQRQSV
jgi:hypothetical protein